MNLAVVVATSHDHPTKVLADGARLIPDYLRKHPGFRDVLEFFDTEAVTSRVFVQLLESRHAGAKITLGVFVAHGSEKGLHDRTGNLLLELQTCKQFDGALLILCSCLCTGKFPEEVTKLTVDGRKCVQYVIGYLESMSVPTRSELRRNRALRESLQTVLWYHVAAVIKDQNIKDSLHQIRRCWETVQDSGRLSKGAALFAQLNARRLRLWEDGKVRH